MWLHQPEQYVVFRQNIRKPRLVSVMEVAASISAKGLEGWGQGHFLGLRLCDERPQVSRQSVGN
jgi:hypothetical protein